MVVNRSLVSVQIYTTLTYTNQRPIHIICTFKPDAFNHTCVFLLLTTHGILILLKFCLEAKYFLEFYKQKKKEENEFFFLSFFSTYKYWPRWSTIIFGLPPAGDILEMVECIFNLLRFILNESDQPVSVPYAIRIGILAFLETAAWGIDFRAGRKDKESITLKDEKMNGK